MNVLSSTSQVQGLSTKYQDGIAIIGAGLTGLMCALYLAKYGFKIQVFEHRSYQEICAADHQVISKKNRSMSMDISYRGIYALKAVGVFELVLLNSVPMKYRIIHDLADNQKFLAYDPREEQQILTISRTRLYEILFNQCQIFKNIYIHFNHRLLSINFKDKTLLITNNGSCQVKKIKPEIVIGADGVNSSVRMMMQQTSNVAFDISYFPMGYKELNIPTEFAKKLYFNAMHMWPRYGAMLVAQPNFENSFTCALLMKESGEGLSFSSIDSSKKIRKFFITYFSDIASCMPNLEWEYVNHPVGKLKIINGKTWSIDDFVLIIGDAAHAMVPFFGQGVNCCFEDCTFLSDCLIRYGTDWPKIFSRFNQVRVANANAINLLSYENYPELFTDKDIRRLQLIKEIEDVLSKKYSDSFRTYHNLVCFDRVPYTMAQKIKSIQSSLLEKLSHNINSIGEIDQQLMEHEMANYMQDLKQITKGKLYGF
jgi:kynurenine 3-monooxygenase